MALRARRRNFRCPSNAPYAVSLLRARRERRCRSAAEESDEFAPSKASAHLALLCLRGKK
jgi:hypothetical protein